MRKAKDTRLEARFNQPKTVLAFSNTLVLKAMFSSANAAEQMTGISHQALINAINGNSITAMGYYWREVYGDFEVEQDDLGTLTLLRFDDEMGNNRLIYATRNMKRGEEILESQYKDRLKIINKKK